jgi:hypothetical protein
MDECVELLREADQQPDPEGFVRLTSGQTGTLIAVIRDAEGIIHTNLDLIAANYGLLPAPAEPGSACLARMWPSILRITRQGRKRKTGNVFHFGNPTLGSAGTEWLSPSRIQAG